MKPENMLTACSYKDLYKHTPVIHKNTIEDYILCEIPTECIDLTLYEFRNISGRLNEELNIYKTIIKEPNHPWLKISSKVLDLDSGKHQYKMKFIGPCLREPVIYYLSYIIQDDYPDTPYIYMKREAKDF